MLAMLGENSPRENLLRSIETQAELLEHELARFIDYSDGFKIVNFAETSPTQKLKRVLCAPRDVALERINADWGYVVGGGWELG